MLFRSISDEQRIHPSDRDGVPLGSVLRSAPSGGAIATGESPWTLETGTVSFLTSYDGYSHLRPSCSQQYFRNRGAARRVSHVRRLGIDIGPESVA